MTGALKVAQCHRCATAHDLNEFGVLSVPSQPNDLGVLSLGNDPVRLSLVRVQE